jgi:glycosyltransferase involved in cell wall biosynthesis
MKTLSYIVPAYNEEQNLELIIEKVLSTTLPHRTKKEIIIINDKSKDKTLTVAKALAKKHKEITVLNNTKNLGKTQTVRKGILKSTGDYVVIQDADLEYDPEDIVLLYDQLLKNKCDVAYGNRFGVDNGFVYFANFYGNIFISFISSLFTSSRLHVMIPDMEVCYKMVRRDVIRDIAQGIISTSNFGFEPEITAKLSRYKLNGEKLKFIVLPIRYYPRTVEEGKKMKAFQDGFKALFEILRFNIF